MSSASFWISYYVWFLQVIVVKMILEVLTCHCYKNEFLDFADNSFCQHRIHMKCMCQRKHSFYVLFCEEHTCESKFIGRGNFKIEEECKCKNGAPQEVCNFCFSVRYILNLSVINFIWVSCLLYLLIKLFLWMIIWEKLIVICFFLS